MIVEDLRPLAQPLDKLTLFPGNPRQGDVDAIARSLQTFGQRKPIVANRNGTVVAGNHTVLAAQQLGWSELAVVWVDDTETMAQAFALADNRTAELGGYDTAALAELIQAVQAADEGLLAAVSYTADDLAELLNSPALAGVGALVPPDDFAAYGEGLATEHRCPSCGYEWSGKA